MTLAELLIFIDEQDKLLKDYHALEPQMRIFARTLKVQEEVGELADAVLASQAFQRADKLENSSQENLEGELADVILTVFLLAKTLDVDMQQALEKKIATIRARNNL